MLRKDKFVIMVRILLRYQLEAGSIKNRFSHLVNKINANP